VVPAVCGGKGGAPEWGTWDKTCTLCDGEGECTLMQAAEWYAEKKPVDAEIDRLARAERWVEKGWLKRALALIALVGLAGCQSYAERQAEQAHASCVEFGYAPGTPE
jgi:hypothetical protein